MYPTLDILKERITQQFIDAGFSATGAPASPETTIVNSIAIEIFNMYNQLHGRINSNDPRSAVGLELDTYGELRGMPRLTAQLAVDATRQNVYFELEAGGAYPVTVPINTRVISNTGVEYITTEAVTLEIDTTAGRKYAAVKAAGIGSAYNVSANSFRSHDFPNPKVRVGNVFPIETGSNTESDAEYRPRLLRYWSVLRNTNSIALEARLRAIPNLADLIIKPHTYGIGSVSVFVESTEPITGPALIAQAQAEAERATAAGVRVFVEYPEHLFLIPKIEVKLLDPDALSLTTPLVRAAVASYVNSLHRGEPLIYQRLLSEVMSVNGVVDAVFTKLERGIYDVQNQTILYKQTINPSNQDASLTQKWVTAITEITLCDETGV